MAIDAVAADALARGDVCEACVGEGVDCGFFGELEGLVFLGLDWIGREGDGVDWVGLEWTGLDREDGFVKMG